MCVFSANVQSAVHICCYLQCSCLMLSHVNNVSLDFNTVLDLLFNLVLVDCCCSNVCRHLH